MTMIMSMMMLINLLMMFMNHPLSMGLLLMIQTILTSMLTGLMMNTFWMSYILLISMLSGMLVLFIYMSSMASNEKFMNSPSMWMLMFMAMIIGLSFLFLEEKMIIKNNYFSMEMEMMKNEIFSLNKMFNMKNMYITIMLVYYLLMTMIVSTHLVNIFEGPMRMKM